MRWKIISATNLFSRIAPQMLSQSLNSHCRMRGILILLGFLLLMGACTKNEVKLRFQLPKDVNEPCRILYYASGKNAGMIRETVVQINAGKGEAVLPMRYPSVIYLFSPSQRIPSALVYAERGDLFTVTGKNGNVSEWNVSGNKVTETLSAWRLENQSLIKSKERETEKLNKAVADFVKGNSADPAAAIILYYYFVRRNHEKEFFRLQASLAPEVRGDEELLTALSMPDLITSLPDVAGIPREIVLVGDSGYADTVRLNKNGGTFLMFLSSPDGNIPVDTLKSLLERRKKGTLAEIYMDIDSMSWRRYLRKDTIKGLKRLWMPMGLADSIALEAGVRRAPYYIVIDSEGKDVYRGDDWKEAAGKFRKLTP